MICMAIGYSGYGFVSSTAGIVIFKLLEGCGQAFVNVTCIVVISATVPKSKVASVVGIFGVAQCLANAAGPSIGLYLSQVLDYKYTFLCAGGVLLVGAVLTMLVKLPFTAKKKFKLSLQSFWAKEALIPCILMFLFIGSSNSINSFLVVYSNTLGLDAVKVGLFFTVQNIAMIFTRPIFGRLADRLGGFKIVCTSSIAMIAVFLLIMQGNLTCILIAGFVGCFGFGPLQPVLQGLAMKYVPNEKRGAASSMIYVFMDLATLFIPTLVGFVADSTGNYAAIWSSLCVLIVIAFIIAFLYRGKMAEYESTAN
ncbi:MAG: MFS transporter [Lachnospiraceae bacterium]|nr:MFS transporter [Lachnospiraceae bacterium]